MVQNDPTAVVQDVDQVENQGEEEMEFVDNKSTGGPEVDMNNISNCRKTEIENDEECQQINKSINQELRNEEKDEVDSVYSELNETMEDNRMRNS